MSFISSIKKIFGFSSDEGLDEYLQIDEQSRTETSAESEKPVQQPSETQPDIDALSGEIFNDIITMFNNFQPEFVKQCLDTDAQKKYLINAINSSIRHQLETVTESARRAGGHKWDNERENMSREMDKLKEKCSGLVTRQEELKNAKLSADRQRRALNERIHDLENQVNTLIAEKEQYELENRSMLNKLRVAGVTGAAGTQQPEPDNDELEGLKATIGKLSDENAALKNEKAELESRIASLEQNNTSIEKQLSEANDEISSYKLTVDQTKAKDQISEAMLNEWRKKATESEKRYKEAQDDIKSLESTIQSNLMAHAKSEDELRKQLEEAKSHSESDNQTSAIDNASDANSPDGESTSPKRRRGRPKKPKISAIDDMIDSTDWLVAPPLPAKKEKDDENDDFGYKAPVRKSHPDDEKQLSLW